MISCQSGFDGGLEQRFHLEVWNSVTGELLYNASNNSPDFYVSDLKPNAPLKFNVYSGNIKGKSAPVKIEGSTLKLPKNPLKSKY